MSAALTCCYKHTGSFPGSFSSQFISKTVEENFGLQLLARTEKEP